MSSEEHQDTEPKPYVNPDCTAVVALLGSVTAGRRAIAIARNFEEHSTALHIANDFVVRDVCDGLAVLFGRVLRNSSAADRARFEALVTLIAGEAERS